MLKRFAGGLAVLVLLTGSAQAATCPPYTYNLTNGTTADANQVMGDFNSILNCANTMAPLASPIFTGIATIQGSAPTIFVLNSSTSTSAVFAQFQSSGTSQGYLGYESGSLTFLNAAGSAPLLTLSNSGNLAAAGTVSGTSFVTTSDARLKKNVVQISDALSLVKQLRGVRYDWRSAKEKEVGKDLNLPSDEKQIGFLAQEVEKVVPEAVVTAKQGGRDVYGLKEGALTPVLVEAIKEQQAEIESLKSQVAALKAAH